VSAGVTRTGPGRSQRTASCALALLLASCALLPGCGAPPVGEEELVAVGPGELVIGVDVAGTLKARRSLQVGPPVSSEAWDFKITRLAPEGSEVKKGALVIAFDATDLERERLERGADLETAVKEIARKQQDLELARRDGELRLAEAEAAARKARLKADLPAKYTAAIELKLAQVDLEAALADLAMAKKRLEHTLALGRAELSYLRDRHARYQERLRRLGETIAALEVRAPIDGVVVYQANWRGEKRKVGDDCYAGRGCIEITDVADLYAEAEVDEVESARVTIGQRARFRLEALPEVEWTGTVESLRPNVYRQSPRNPIKVIGVKIKLDKIEPRRMRPGMQLRGRLEIERVVGALLAPVEAILPRPSGPVVLRRTVTGWQEVRVELGRRTRTHAEVLRGLAPGDRIARRDLGLRGDPS
jgi:HlyD family secretion protein